MNTNPVLVAYEIMVKLMGEGSSVVETLIPGESWTNMEHNFLIENKTRRKAYVMVVFENGGQDEGDDGESD